MASLKKIIKKSYNVIKLNKTNKTATIMSDLQLHAVLTHIYIVTQSQCSFYEYSLKFSDDLNLATLNFGTF